MFWHLLKKNATGSLLEMHIWGVNVMTICFKQCGGHIYFGFLERAKPEKREESGEFERALGAVDDTLRYGRCAPGHTLLTPGQMRAK